MKIRVIAAALLVLGLFGGPAVTQTAYPTKPVKWIVPFPPGGATDAVARYLAQEMSEKLGQQFVIDNRAGANGSLGTAIGKTSPPDGYTVLTGSSGVMLVNPSIYPDVTYDARTDFSPIGKVAALNNVVIVSTKLAKEQNIKTLADLVRYAKANPGKINYGSGGIGNGGHLAAELINSAAGIQMTHVPFKGGADANRALIAGDIDVLVNTTPEAVPLIRANQAVPLASMTKERLAGLPAVPTISEAGVQGAEMASWMSVIAPKGVPPEIITKLNTTLNAILASDKTKVFFDNLLLTRDPTTPEQLQALIVSEHPRFQEILKKSGVSLNK